MVVQSLAETVLPRRAHLQGRRDCAVLGQLQRASPDHRHVIEDLIAEEDRVVARVTFSGTHAGCFRGIPATGRRVRQSQIHIVRLAQRRVVEHWATCDDRALLAQLGLWPVLSAARTWTDRSVPTDTP
jgi:predicted ester cyclase